MFLKCGVISQFVSFMYIINVYNGWNELRIPYLILILHFFRKEIQTDTQSNVEKCWNLFLWKRDTLNINPRRADLIVCCFNELFIGDDILNKYVSLNQYVWQNGSF